MDDLEVAQACADSMYGNDLASRDLGITVRILEPGVAQSEMTVTRSMVNGYDICHGGYIFILADSAFAYACNAYDEVTVAAGASIDFTYSAKLGDQLTATAREVHKGRRSGLYDVEVVNQDDHLVAIFRGRSAALGKPILPTN